MKVSASNEDGLTLGRVIRFLVACVSVENARGPLQFLVLENYKLIKITFESKSEEVPADKWNPITYTRDVKIYIIQYINYIRFVVECVELACSVVTDVSNFADIAIQRLELY